VLLPDRTPLRVSVSVGGSPCAAHGAIVMAPGRGGCGTARPLRTSEPVSCAPGESPAADPVDPDPTDQDSSPSPSPTAVLLPLVTPLSGMAVDVAVGSTSTGATCAAVIIPPAATASAGAIHRIGEARRERRWERRRERAGALPARRGPPLRAVGRSRSAMAAPSPVSAPPSAPAAPSSRRTSQGTGARPPAPVPPGQPRTGAPRPLLDVVPGFQQCPGCCTRGPTGTRSSTPAKPGVAKPMCPLTHSPQRAGDDPGPTCPATERRTR
jgi:hypothetical protein